MLTGAGGKLNKKLTPVVSSTSKLDQDNQQQREEDEGKEQFALEWRNVTVEVDIDLNKKTKKQLTIIQSGTIFSGEITAVMGPSGCGKTSLLNVLVGRIGEGRIYGQVHFAGSKRNPATWSCECAFIEQNDIFHPHLTVAETMNFAADFRLDCTLTKEQKHTIVFDIIQDLGLINCMETRVGNVFFPGISGGEKKRLSVAIELLTSPKILVMDEPTTGLDSFTAFNVIQLLKNAAKKRNIAMLMTIHQPRTDLLNLFDGLCLLTVGKCLYFGPVTKAVSYFQTQGFNLPPATNPADYYLDIISLDQRSPALQKASLTQIDTLHRAWLSASRPNFPPLFEEDLKSIEVFQNVVPIVRKRSFILEFKTLLRRSLITVARDSTAIRLSFYTAIIVGSLVGGVIWNAGSDTNGTLAHVGCFFSSAVFLFMRANNAALPVFSSEKEISKRERASNSYNIVTAVLTKFVAQIPVVLTSSFVFSIIMYYMGSFNPSVGAFFTFLLIVLVMTMGAISAGLLVAAAVPSISTAQIIGPLINVANSLFGGWAISLASMPPWIGWLRWFAVVSNGMGAMMVNEFTGRTLTCTTTGGLCYSAGAQVISAYNFQMLTVAEYLFINLALTVFFLILGVYYFEKMTRPLMRLKTLKYSKGT